MAAEEARTTEHKVGQHILTKILRHCLNKCYMIYLIMVGAQSSVYLNCLSCKELSSHCKIYAVVILELLVT